MCILSRRCTRSPRHLLCVLDCDFTCSTLKLLSVTFAEDWTVFVSFISASENPEWFILLVDLSRLKIRRSVVCGVIALAASMAYSVWQHVWYLSVCLSVPSFSNIIVDIPSVHFSPCLRVSVYLSVICFFSSVREQQEESAVVHTFRVTVPYLIPMGWELCSQWGCFSWHPTNSVKALCVRGTYENAL